MAKVKWALIGVGGYGGKLAMAARKVSSLQLVSCYHPDPQKTKDAARKLECKPVFNEKEIINDREIDAVIIATPDPSHLGYIQLAMQAGKHIFVEKPMVGTWADVGLLQEQISHYKGVFFVGHNMRREEGFRRIKREYAEGTLGRLVTFHIVLSHGGALNWRQDYWRTKPEFCREGPMRVNGVHASDVLEYLFGPIISVYAKLDRRHAPQVTPDSGIVMVNLGGVYGTVCTHWNVPSLNQFQFQFTDALINYDLHNLTIRYGRDHEGIQPPTQKIMLPETDSRVAQMMEFAEAVQGHCSVETGFREGYRAVMFFEACWRSDRLQQEYKLEDLL